MISRKPVERNDRADVVPDADVGAALGYSRPGSYEELRAVLSSGTARLPKKLRQVAIHLWQHPTAVALGTVTSVAREAGVQPSTLVRFAQAFGYSGFSDLQEVFKVDLAGGGRSRDRWESASSSEAARLVDGFIGSCTAALAGVRDRLDLAQFEIMSETLAAADLIYIIGSKRAFSIVSYVSLALANLGVRNLALDNVGSTAFELLRCASTSDAVLAVSFTPYNSITPELAASAAQRGVPIVSLTDSAFSPLVPVSKAYVEVIEESFSGFKSLSATLAVAMALVLRVEQRRSEAAARSRDVSNTTGLGEGEDLRLRKSRIVGLNFEHAHMGDLLREVYEHPNAEIAGVWDNDKARMAEAIANFSIPGERVYRDIAQCVRETHPDLAILCPMTARHADVVEEVAALGIDILLEKPFAASLADADRMLAAVEKSGVRLAVNWPLRWYPSHVTTKRLIDEGVVGEVIEVHFYDGNRGPLYHRADKVTVSDEEVRREKPTSWWYSKASGGGSLLDYLGYGATLGTWFMNGEAPIEVTAVVDHPAGLEVDEHSIVICRYARGLSKLETRWGTFTDPWTTQPQPKCGFVVVGSEGTISSYDYDAHVGVQTRSQPTIRQVPVDELKAPFRKPVEYVLHCKERDLPFEGPLDPVLCRTAQRIVDTAALSARERRTLTLLP